MRYTSYHDKRLARRLEDPEFRAEYERKRREIDRIEKEELLWAQLFKPDIGDEPFMHSWYK